MAYSVESRAGNPANLLREAQEKAERLVISVNRDNVESFLALLDEIEQMFDELGKEPNIDLRPEQGRWESLLNRVSSHPGPIASAAAKAGGFAKLRAQHPPAESFWWYLDAEVNRRRGHAIKRAALTLGSIVAVIAIALWALNTFFPPNPNTVALVDATGRIEQLASDQKWQEALQATEDGLQKLPNEPELVIWRAVLLERLGKKTDAQATANLAQQLMAQQPIAFWITLGNDRLLAGDLRRRGAGRPTSPKDRCELSPSLLLVGRCGRGPQRYCNSHSNV